MRNPARRIRDVPVGSIDRRTSTRFVTALAQQLVSSVLTEEAIYLRAAQIAMERENLNLLDG
jgi:hypothetical protein